MADEKVFTLSETGWTGRIFAHHLMGFRYKWHTDVYEISMILRGNAEFTIDGRLYHLDEDDAVFIDPGAAHGSLTLEPGSVAAVVHVSRAALADKTSGTRLSFTDPASAACAPAPLRLLRYCVARMLLTDDSAPKSERELAFAELLYQLPRLGNSRMIPEDTSIEESAQILQRITGYIDEHYAQKLSLEEIAAHANYSRTYLSTFFKNKLGMNLHEYIVRVRFRRATFELTATGKSLTEIAIDNGFSNLDTFNRRFKETYHQLPSEYRRRVASEQAVKNLGEKFYCSPHEPEIYAKLQEYLNLSL